jgi:hypothetical protein
LYVLIFKMNEIILYISDSSLSSDNEDIVNIIERLNHPRKKRIYRNRLDHYSIWYEIEFYNQFRLSKHVLNVILTLILDKIQYPTNRYTKIKRN